MRPGRLHRGWFVFAIGVAALIVTLTVYFERGFVPGDAIVYLAAGERLNAGHQLYALMPGDRPVGLKPPYWTVPLLSPPLIGVVFRPLAALPGDLGAYLWWMLTMAAIAASVLLLAARRPGLTGTALLVLGIPLTYEIGVGNVNGLLLLGAIGAWWLTRQDRDGAAGGLVGLMIALKLTPAVLALWLLVERRWWALGAAIAAVLAAVVVTSLGAGFQANLDYLGVIRQTNVTGSSDLSLAGMARFVGLSADLARWLPAVALLLCLATMTALRGRPGASFSVAIAAWVVGSPVDNINTFALLLAALAPAAWPTIATNAEALHRLGRASPGLSRPSGG